MHLLTNIIPKPNLCLDLLLPSSLTVFSPSASFLAVMIVVSPSEERFRPISRPIPLLPPVTMATSFLDHLVFDEKAIGLGLELKDGKLNLMNLDYDVSCVYNNLFGVSKL